MKKITEKSLQKFRAYLEEEEKSASTVEKYLRDVRAFGRWLGEKSISKEVLLQYKQALVQSYAPRSVNSKISSVNSFLGFIGRSDCRVKLLKLQHRLFVDTETELTKEEYEKLLGCALKEKNEKLYYLMQTICSTGIRVSELKYITVEAVNEHRAIINNKNKMRVVLLPFQLCEILEKYIRKQCLSTGCVFVTKNGNPLNRTNIWKMLKGLCKSAEIPERKVYPHNFRHLFARTFYSAHKDIVRLADVLGHSGINTTRIYTVESGNVHRNQIQSLDLVKF